MRIIISPAKKMKNDEGGLNYKTLPEFMEKTTELKEYMQSLSLEEARELWQCNEKIALKAYSELQELDLLNNLTAAIFCYDGIQYKTMKPEVFTSDMLNFLNENVRILSGFYGVLKPFDGIACYRLEMLAKININNQNSLYEFWGDNLYKEILDESKIILNLASKEYGKAITPYLKKNDRLVSCNFVENSNGKLVQKGTYAKMARGAMVRFLAENNYTELAKVKLFNEFAFQYSEEYSSKDELVFIKQ